MTPLFPQAVASFQRGQFEQAERLCADILRAEPRHCDALHLLGLLVFRRGDAGRAMDLWNRSLAINPRQPAVHVNLSSAQLQLFDPEAALVSCESALTLRPDFADAFNNRGTALLALDRPVDALASYDRAIRFKADFAIFHCNRARALIALARPVEALEAYERALEIQPEDRDALLAAGNLLVELDRPDRALTCYDRLLALVPSDADAAYNRGLVLERMARYEEALQSFDRSIAHNPRVAKIHHHRGNALRALQRHAEALASHRTAIALQPNYPAALCGAGDALRELGRFAEARDFYDSALAIEPDDVDALRNRARILLAMREPGEAVRCYERLLQTTPTAAQSNYVLGHFLHARLSCCDWRDFDALAEAIVTGVRDAKRVTLPSLCIATSGIPRVQQECARLFFADNWEASSRSALALSAYRHDKIRLAYVSADFRDHAVASLLVSVIEDHDRDRFDVVGVSLRVPDRSTLGRRIESAFDRFIDVSQQTDADVATLLRALEIDIAIDLNGYTDGFRPGIFACRAAPVQVNFLGYTGTTSSPAMDYIVADHVIIPPADRGYFSESIAYLPGCYLPADSRREIADGTPSRVDIGLPEAGVVFCCFNNHYKIGPQAFDIWMHMLRSVERSVLWFAAGNVDVIRNLRAEAEKRAVDPARLVFAPRVPDRREHLARYRVADLFLDTLPFNAHTTASEALFAGLPVLTCRGSAFAGRVAASLLTAAALPELIAENWDDYCERGIALASRPDDLRELRRRLTRAKAVSSMFDASHYQRKLETAYTMMWQRSLRGEQPGTFEVS